MLDFKVRILLKTNEIFFKSKMDNLILAEAVILFFSGSQDFKFWYGVWRMFFYQPFYSMWKKNDLWETLATGCVLLLSSGSNTSRLVLSKQRR